MHKLGSIIMLLSFAMMANSQCWLASYGRGVGVPVSACNSNQDKNGALCYPKCRSGYTGVGPVCWSGCPNG